MTGLTRKQNNPHPLPPEAVKKLAAYASARKDRRLVEALAGGVSYGVGNHPY